MIDKKIELTSRHYITIGSLAAILAWVVSTTYFFAKSMEIDPLKARLGEAQAALNAESATAEQHEAEWKRISEAYNVCVGQSELPVLLHPRDGAELFSPQISFRWDYKKHDEELQNYILEIRELGGNGNEFTYNVPTPQLKTMYVPRSILGTEEFIWRIVPGSKSGNRRNIQGPSSGGFVFRTYDSLWHKIKKEGRVVIGTSPYLGVSRGFSIVDAEGNSKGLDVELARWLFQEISKRENDSNDIKVIIESRPFARLLPDLARGDLDIIVSNLTASKSREKKYGVQFSHGYFFDVDQYFITNKDHEQTFPGALRGSEVGVVENTTNATSAEVLQVRYGFRLKNPYYKTWAAAFEALDHGEIDFTLMDRATVNTQRREAGLKLYGPSLNSKLKQLYLKEYGTADPYYGVALKREKNSQLLSMINDLLTSSSGKEKLEELKSRWLEDSDENL